MAERARRSGPVRFDVVMELALYAPGAGFYQTGGHAGREGGQFLTSPEVGPLFGAVLARALDTWWRELDRPDPYVAVEAGAGRGTLAASVLAARPACAPALRYLLVERSDALRRAQAGRLALEPAGEVLGALTGGGGDEPPVVLGGLGPLAASLGELPAGPFPGVVLANELLDNLPFRLLRRAGDGWHEVFVDEHLDEVMVPAEEEAAARADALAPGAPLGASVPLQDQAREWLRSALACPQRGRIVVADYADRTASLADRPVATWLRTYRTHGPGGPVLSELGRQDITCEVAVDQLATVQAPSSDRSQAEFLAAHGIGVLADEARRSWTDRAAVGDLDALKARSRVSEAAALTDPAGLGAFRVVEWTVPDPSNR